jgi:hypothetical protein
MKRFALILATLAILCVAATQAQAHGYHHGYGVYYGGYYRAPVVVCPPVWVAPQAFVPTPVYPRVYRPSCNYPYAYGPSCGFYYQGSGLSIGVGF